MSTANKLTYLNTTKQNLKTVINTTGASLTDESTLRSYANVLNDKILGAINGDVDLFEEYPKVSGNGTDLSLNGVVEGKMSITPKGVSKQGGTDGYNIMNFNVSGQDSKVTVNDDGTITINGAGGFGIAMEPITLLANTTYKQKIEVVSGSLTGNINNSFMSFNGAGSIWLSSTNYVAYTPTEDQTKTLLWVNASSTFNNLKIKIWGYKGTENKDWEPYTGGIPAPNPDYSYPVKSVTGENGLIINGTNLANPLLESGTIDATTGEDISNNKYRRMVNYIYFGNANTLYFKRTGDTTNMKARWYDENKNYVGSSPAIQNSLEKTLTPPTNAKYLRIAIDNDNSNYFTDYKVIVSTIDISYIEHEEQNYQLSLGNIELNSSPDGTIRDQIVGKPNEWYKREYIGKVVLDGSENWLSYTNPGTKLLTFRAVRSELKNNTVVTCCNFFKKATSMYSPQNGEFTNRYANYYNLEFIWTNIASVDDFKAWLKEKYEAGNPVIIWYQLAQYTDIPITDTTLISQLNDIYNNAHSYNGVTNITTTYEDGNEQMYLDIEALKNVWDTSL